MARGWESKSVEQQQEEVAEQRKSFRERSARALISPTPPPKEQQRNRKREGLLLSRGRLRQQLQAASHPRHRQMLEQAIAEVDRQLSSFEPVADTKSRK
jgi:predicted component of type VI protein secretion system